jgi:hypothetical protein
MLAFRWPQAGAIRALLPACLFAGLLGGGELLWRWRTRRVAIVLLMSAAILCPISLATGLSYMNWFAGGFRGEDLLPGVLTNHQLLAAAIVSFLFASALWWRTRTSALAMIWGLSVVLLATAAFGVAGLRTHLAAGRIDTVAGWYLWPGLGLLAVGMAWDIRWKRPQFAAPLYLMAVVLLLLALTLVARFGPTLRWLGAIHPEAGADVSRQVKYGFMINGAAYLLLGLLADRSASSRWLRRIGTLLFWLAPSHILIPILTLENEWPVMGSAWTAPEILLPIGALGFVFASVPKQMKSFFFSGLFYVAIAVQRLTARHFEDALAWPVLLALIGLILAAAAWRHPSLFDRTRRGQR